MPETAEHHLPAIASDAEIDAVIAEFNGDARLAIRALLHDMSLIVRDSEAVVSRGFVRGRLLSFNLPDAGKKASS
jgi:hypothetical protein